MRMESRITPVFDILRCHTLTLTPIAVGRARCARNKRVASHRLVLNKSRSPWLLSKGRDSKAADSRLRTDVAGLILARVRLRLGLAPRLAPPSTSFRVTNVLVVPVFSFNRKVVGKHSAFANPPGQVSNQTRGVYNMLTLAREGYLSGARSFKIVYDPWKISTGIKTHKFRKCPVDSPLIPQQIERQLYRGYYRLHKTDVVAVGTRSRNL